MDLMKMGTELIMQKMNLNVGSDVVQSALGSLMGGSDGGGVDIMGLVSKMKGNSGLSSLVGSFLGDGSNENMTGSNIMDVFGSEKVGQFASQLGVSEDDASDGLSNIIPELIDKASSGGNLMGAISGGEGLGGLLKKAKSLF